MVFLISAPWYQDSDRSKLSYAASMGFLHVQYKPSCFVSGQRNLKGPSLERYADESDRVLHIQVIVDFVIIISP